MNERIMEAVEKIEAIKASMGKQYVYANNQGERVRADQYFYKGNNFIPKERAITDRTRMLDVLRRFYCAHSGNHDGMDDFVTLFGVYCNHYIRFNLHQAIPEDKDFGISALWDVVTNEKIQRYLSLLQQGIFNGIFAEGEKDFFKAFKSVPDYSLPALYLFIWNFKRFQESTLNNQKQLFKDNMLYYAKRMNKALFDYCVGAPEFLNNKKLNKGHRNDAPDSRYASPGRSDTALPYIVWFSKDDFPTALRADLWTSTSFNVPMEMHRDDDYLPRRLYFLSIPYMIEGDREVFFGVFIQYLIELSNSQDEKAELQKEKEEIVRDFSHTYQNMGATALYNMAKTLLNRPNAEDRLLGRTALLEYTRKETQTKDIYMMKLKYEHNTEKLRNILRQSCTCPSPELHTIHDVLHQALLMCLVTAFYDRGTENARRMRKHLKELWLEWKDAVLDFEKSIIFQGEDCLKWLRTQGIDFRVEEDAAWQSIGFFPDGYAAVLLRNILTELFVNTFKYGDLRQQIALTFAGLEQAITIEMENYLPDSKHGTSNSQVGIHSMRKMLHVLWGDELKEDNERLTASYKDNKFHACLSLPMTVFSAKEEAK